MLFVLVLGATQVKAQAHDNSRRACRLFKNIAQEEGAICPGCQADYKKEQAARDAENKRRNDVVKAKAEAAEKVREIARKKEQAEREANNKVTKVFVTMPKSTSIKTAAPDKTTQPKEIVKNYFYAENDDINIRSITDMYNPTGSRGEKASDHFIINNEKRFINNEFKACIGSLVRNIPKEEYNFPPNVGIVVLNESFTDKNGNNLQISDLIDPKGNRILNDNSISTIIHFADDNFIAFRGKPDKSWGYNYVRFFRYAGDAFIYNLKTKQKHPIPRYTIDGTDLGYEFDSVVNLGTGNDIDKSKYKARFRSKLKSGVRWAEYIYYFITQDGKLEEKQVSQ